MIMTDQQRWDSLGISGAIGYSTPNLDRLASQGTLFDACYCDNPVCTPSRASLFTGKQLPGHGVYRLHDILPKDQTPFPYLLKQAGYHTALFGKWHLSGRIEEESRRHPRDGFDIYEWCMEASVSLESPLNAYGRWLEKENPDFYERLKREKRALGAMPAEYSFTHWAAERTISFLEDQTRSTAAQTEPSKPWFCMMSVFDPHNPYDDSPPEYLDRVGEPAEPISDPALADTPIPGIRAELQHSYLGASAGFSADDIRSMRKGYAASLVLLDDEVGRVLEALDRGGQAERPMVIFTSDHGDMLGDHGLYVKGAFFYDPCVRVPLIIRHPGVLTPGTFVEEPVQLRDIASTVMAAAEAEESLFAEQNVESRNLCTLARSETTARTHVICRYRNTGINDRGDYWTPEIHASMIRRGDWKLNWYHHNAGPGTLTGPQARDVPRIQLFNLASSMISQNFQRRPAIAPNSLKSCLKNWLETSAPSVPGVEMPVPQRLRKSTISKERAHEKQLLEKPHTAGCAGDTRTLRRN